MKIVKLLPLFIVLLGVSFAVRLMGFLFKIHHWTGGIAMSKYGNIALMVCLLIVVALTTKSNARPELSKPLAYQPRWLKMFIMIMLCLFVIAMIFNIQHWKVAGIQFFMVIPILSITVIVACCIAAYKVWEADKIKQ